LINDNIGALFQEDPSAPPAMALRQGVVQSWNTSTGENTIQVAGATLVNIPALTAESATLKANDVVALLTTGDTWLVIGKVTVPGDPGTVPTWVGDITALAPLTDLATVTTGLLMIGATNATAEPGSGAHAVLNDPAYPGQVALFSGNAGEVDPGLIMPVLGGADYGKLEIRSPALVVDQFCYIEMDGFDDGTTSMVSQADTNRVQGDLLRLHGFNEIEIGDSANNITIIGQEVTNADLSSATNTFPGQMLAQSLSAACTALVSLTTTEVDITGATVTFTTTKPNARYMCTGSFYYGAGGASLGVAQGKLNVDGTNQAAFANFTGTNTTQDRTNSSQTWSGTLASAGSHTLKLRGVHSLASSAISVNPVSTTITVLVFE
jgi:hypothetical protein